VKPHQGTGTTWYLLDGSSVLEELDATNATTIRYLNNPRQIDEVLAYQRGSQTEFPLVDGLGSLFASTDASGTVVHRYDFDAHGKRTDLGGSAPAVDVGYTGRWHDANGLIEYRPRLRRPELGGWLSADPLRSGNILDVPSLVVFAREGQLLAAGGSVVENNLSDAYLYGDAQPTQKLDPSGLRALFNDTWNGHERERLQLSAAYTNLSRHLCAHNWFTQSWMVDPFESDQTFSFQNSSSLGGIACQLISSMNASTSGYTGDITLCKSTFEGRNVANVMREVHAVVMHELNNSVAGFGHDDNSGTGSYTAETIGYQVFDGKCGNGDCGP